MSTTPSRTCALTLGEALRQALGDKRGIARYGFLLPMDEAARRSHRPVGPRLCLVFEGQFGREGRSVAHRAGAAFLPLAGRQRSAPTCTSRYVGDNTHHMIEACFKGRRPRAAPGLARERQSICPAPRACL
jgi:imidazoleglycerol-phosphate dehydratase/histidinol-phosphatase